MRVGEGEVEEEEEEKEEVLLTQNELSKRRGLQGSYTLVVPRGVTVVSLFLLRCV
jgi:hypothetical protein